MAQIKIQRIYEAPYGTIGELLILRDGAWRHFCMTLEPPDLGNGDLSNIPPADYRCKNTVYIKGGYPTYEVTGVPGRSRIRGKRLIKKEWLDEFLEQHEVSSRNELEGIVDEVCKDINRIQT